MAANFGRWMRGNRPMNPTLLKTIEFLNGVACALASAMVQVGSLKAFASEPATVCSTRRSGQRSAA